MFSIYQEKIGNVGWNYLYSNVCKLHCIKLEFDIVDNKYIFFE